MRFSQLTLFAPLLLGSLSVAHPRPSTMLWRRDNEQPCKVCTDCVFNEKDPSTQTLPVEDGGDSMTSLYGNDNYIAVDFNSYPHNPDEYQSRTMGIVTNEKQGAYLVQIVFKHQNSDSGLTTGPNPETPLVFKLEGGPIGCKGEIPNGWDFGDAVSVKAQKITAGTTPTTPGKDQPGKDQGKNGGNGDKVTKSHPKKCKPNHPTS